MITYVLRKRNALDPTYCLGIHCSTCRYFFLGPFFGKNSFFRADACFSSNGGTKSFRHCSELWALCLLNNYFLMGQMGASANTSPIKKTRCFKASHSYFINLNISKSEVQFFVMRFLLIGSCNVKSWYLMLKKAWSRWFSTIKMPY